MRNGIILTTWIFLNSLFTLAQNEVKADQPKFSSKKGTFYLYWGYNRTTYAKSDIHLKADDYNFILEDVSANDLPSEFSSDYYNPTKLTIPQFNVRLGYNLNEKYAIAIGWDHMKYRTVSCSKATITGRIDPAASSIYAGYYNHDQIVMDSDHLVKMEHSDGFNIINLNVERTDLLISTNNKKWSVSIVNGAGIGIAIPWTNSRIFGVKNDDRIHFSGLGAQLNSALQFNVLQRFFVRYTAQLGFANMWDIAIVPKGDNSAHAEQTIKYFERSVVVGYRFRLFQ